MPLTLVGQGSSATSNNTLVVATTAAVALGETLIAIQHNDDKRGQDSVTGGGTSFTEAREGGGVTVAYDIDTPAIAAGTNFTVTLGGSAAKALHLYKYPGLATIVGTSGTTGNSSTPSTSRAAGLGDDIIGSVTSQNASAISTPAGWTELYQGVIGNIRYASHIKTNVSAGSHTYNPVCSGGNDFGIAAVAVTPPAGSDTVDDLTATGVATGAPSVGFAALGQVHGLSATPIAAGAPSLDAPALSSGGTQVDLTATGIDAGVPSVGSPVLGIAGAIHRYISPTGSGAGTSWADAAAISTLNTRITEAGAGGFVHIRANAGDVYARSAALGLSAGGSAGNPVTIEFVQDDGSDPDPTAWLEGNRTTWTHDPNESVVTDTSLWTAGANYFALNSGANYLTFKKLRFRHVGRGFNVAAAGASGIRIEDPYVYNCRQLISWGVGSGLDVIRPNAVGFSSKFIEASDTAAGLYVAGPGVLDSHRQDKDTGIPRGIAISSSGNGFVIDGLAPDGLEIKNCHYTGTAYWNGDGISTEELCTGVTIRDVYSHGHTDGGFDLKHPAASSVLEGLRAGGNKINYRLWNEDYVIAAPVSETPIKRGGGGPDFPAHFGLYSNATVPNVTVNDATVTEASTGVLVNASDVTGASIHFQDWIAIPAGIDELEENGTATGTTVTFDPPLGGGAHDLVATGIDAGTPSIDAPALGQVHGLAADGITTGALSVGSPALGQAHGFTATEITAGAPDIAEPTFGQAHGLGAEGIDTAAPEVGSPALEQVHALTANGLTTGAPVTGQPTLDAAPGVIPLTADGVEAGAPTTGAPAVGQNHALVASAVEVAAPETGTPALGQVHDLDATGIATGAPSVGQPSIGQNVIVYDLVAEGIATGTPSVGSPTLEQILNLTADSIILPAPDLGEPSMGQVHGLVAAEITAGSPDLGTPALDGIAARFPTVYRGMGQGASVDRRNTASGTRLNRQPSYVRRN